ncbi:MAG: NUDIX domain-containing protein [Actinomycetota bacterium]
MVEFPGPLVRARPASTVLALRPASSGFEVLMVRRAAGSEFMGNAFVFPGGSVDDRDRRDEAATALQWDGDPEELPWRAAALRELHEEAGLTLTDPEGLVIPTGTADLYAATAAAGGKLDAGRLHWVSRWITPEGLPRRFDTRFFVAAVGEGDGTAADGVEVFDDTWVDPRRALAQGDDGSWEVPFPTRWHLEMLARHDSIGAVLDYADSISEVQSVLPRIVIGDNGEYKVSIPGDSDYDVEVGA